MDQGRREYLARMATITIPVELYNAMVKEGQELKQTELANYKLREEKTAMIESVNAEARLKGYRTTWSSEYGYTMRMTKLPARKLKKAGKHR